MIQGYASRRSERLDAERAEAGRPIPVLLEVPAQVATLAAVAAVQDGNLIVRAIANPQRVGELTGLIPFRPNPAGGIAVLTEWLRS